MSRFPFVSEWQREALRTNLWLVPAIEVVAAIALYLVTHALDQDGLSRVAEPSVVGDLRNG